MRPLIPGLAVALLALPACVTTPEAEVPARPPSLTPTEVSASVTDMGATRRWRFVLEETDGALGVRHVREGPGELGPLLEGLDPAGVVLVVSLDENGAPLHLKPGPALAPLLDDDLAFELTGLEQIVAGAWWLAHVQWIGRTDFAAPRALASEHPGTPGRGLLGEVLFGKVGAMTVSQAPSAACDDGAPGCEVWASTITSGPEVPDGLEATAEARVRVEGGLPTRAEVDIKAHIRPAGSSGAGFDRAVQWQVGYAPLE